MGWKRLNGYCNCPEKLRKIGTFSAKDTQNTYEKRLLGLSICFSAIKNTQNAFFQKWLYLLPSKGFVDFVIILMLHLARDFDNKN